MLWYDFNMTSFSPCWHNWLACICFCTCICLLSAYFLFSMLSSLCRAITSFLLRHRRHRLEVWLYLLLKSPYSVRIQENTDQKKLCIWTLFTQCNIQEVRLIWMFPMLLYDIFSYLSLAVFVKMMSKKFSDMFQSSYFIVQWIEWTCLFDCTKLPDSFLDCKRAWLLSADCLKVVNIIWNARVLSGIWKYIDVHRKKIYLDSPRY